MAAKGARTTAYGMWGRYGDRVEGQRCPRCRHESVVYNGNYFCVECPWAMRRDVHRIIRAYLLQRWRVTAGETRASLELALHPYVEGPARMVRVRDFFPVATTSASLINFFGGTR